MRDEEDESDTDRETRAELGDLTFKRREEARLEEVINFTSGSQFLFFLKSQSVTQKPKVEGNLFIKAASVMLAAARCAEFGLVYASKERLRLRRYIVIGRSTFCVGGTRCSALHSRATRGLSQCLFIVSRGVISDSLVFFRSDGE